MSVVRVGTNKKYSENWESIFSKGGKKKSTPAKATRPAAKKATAKKKPKKK